MSVGGGADDEHLSTTSGKVHSMPRGDRKRSHRKRLRGAGKRTTNTRRAVELFLRRRTLCRRGRGTAAERPDVRSGHRARKGYPALSNRDDPRHGPDREQLHCCTRRPTGLGARLRVAWLPCVRRRSGGPGSLRHVVETLWPVRDSAFSVHTAHRRAEIARLVAAGGPTHTVARRPGTRRPVFRSVLGATGRIHYERGQDRRSESAGQSSAPRKNRAGYCADPFAVRRIRLEARGHAPGLGEGARRRRAQWSAVLRPEVPGRKGLVLV